MKDSTVSPSSILARQTSNYASKIFSYPPSHTYALRCHWLEDDIHWGSIRCCWCDVSKQMLAFAIRRSTLYGEADKIKQTHQSALKVKTRTYALPQYWLSALCWEDCGQFCCTSTCEYCKHMPDAVRQCWPGCWLERCSWLCTCDPRCLLNIRRFSKRPPSENRGNNVFRGCTPDLFLYSMS